MKYIVSLNGKDYEVEVDELSEAIVTNVTPTAAPAAPVPAAAPAPAAAPVAPAPAAPAVTGTGTPVVAPMPGTILSVNVSEGQSVSAGDVLFVLEAMKMENEIVAPVSGTVTKVAASKGSTVATDAVLAFVG
ncbi:MAG: biotin/lipoyl-containing protein [Candidatus Fimenecus sp.]